MFGPDAQRRLAAGCHGRAPQRQLQRRPARQRQVRDTARDAAHGNREEVHPGAADEARDEQVARPVVEFQGRAHLLDDPALQHHDLVGHGHGLDLVVGDVDHGRAQLLVQPADLDPGLHAQGRVQVGRAARRTGTRRVRARSPGRSRHAAAGRRRAGPACAAGAARAAAWPRPCRPAGRSRPWADWPSSGRSRCSRPRSCAGRGRRTGTPWPHRGWPAASWSCRGRRSASRPSVMSSSPAIRRSRVDLPQPDGPTKTQNSLSAISRSTPLMMWTSPNRLWTPRKVTSAMFSRPVVRSR